MSNTNAKSISMLLYDGTLNGVVNITDSGWSSGEMYASPRASVSDLFLQENTDNFGVYLLLSDDKVYVGQAQDLKKRIKQHLSGKDWWKKVILLTTNNDSFTRSDIDYLESVLIDKADKTSSLDSDNKNKGNTPKVDKNRKVILEQYLAEALFLMELIGVYVFSNNKKKNSKPKRNDQTVVVGGAPKTTNLPSTKGKPQLPNVDLKIGEYVKLSMRNLEKSGFAFTEEQLDSFSSVEGSKEYTKRNLPMIIPLKDNETRNDIDEKLRKRYWREEFKFGELRFLMYSQWYQDGSSGATLSQFVAWYNSL